MTRDRELLEALFVHQLGFASASEVMSAGVKWLAQRETGSSLSEVLRSEGMLDDQQQRLIDSLVSRALASQGVDAVSTLRVPTPPSAESPSGLGSTFIPLVSNQLSFDSLESPDNVVAEASGRYAFETLGGKPKELGRGAAGRVILARDQFLSRDVAMKELHREVTQDMQRDTLEAEHLESRFLREARITGQLEHPAIVPVYELGRRRDGTLYYTMPRLKGRTLAQALADTPSLEGRLELVSDLLVASRAVAAAHHQKVVHRDLKPQNVMLGPEGETYVLDWGLARVMGRKHREHSTIQLAPDLTGGLQGPVGTPSYMSPEQALGDREELDERADVWGLGAMLFEILTGRAPYLGIDPWEVVADVRTKSPPRVLSLEPRAPPELAAICQKALSRKKERRYLNAEEFALELEAFLNGRRVRAYKYGFRELWSRLYQQHRGKVSLALATAMALGALAAATAVSAGRERDEAREMARFFLSEVAPSLADIPGSSELLRQLSHSALETFARGVDLRRGPMAHRLLLARTWNDVAHQHWRLGQRTESREALDRAQQFLAPLLEQHPKEPEVLAAQLQHEVWRVDLVIDEGAVDEAFRQLEALEKDALRLRSFTSAAAAAARTVFYSRLGMVHELQGHSDLAMAALGHARDAAQDHFHLAPGNLQAADEVLYQSLDLAVVQMNADQRDESLTTLRSLSERAQAMRAQGDSRRLQGSHAAAMLYLALGLHPQAEMKERQRAIDTGRRLVSQLVAVDPDQNSELADATTFALLDGDFEGAWAHASRIEALGLGAEYEKPLIVAAFAVGRDDLVRQKAHTVTTGSAAATASLYAALLATLGGDAKEARTHLRTCLEQRCPHQALWLPGVLLHRLQGRGGPAAEALRRLALEAPLAIGEPKALGTSLVNLDAFLGGVGD